MVVVPWRTGTPVATQEDTPVAMPVAPFDVCQVTNELCIGSGMVILPQPKHAARSPQVQGFKEVGQAVIRR